jgi:putative addiction module component (TIGR02574 family)
MASASQPSIRSLGIDQLPLPQQMQLFEELWETIAAAGQLPETPDWHRAELDRRLANSGANSAAGSSWDEVKTRLRGKQ